MPTTKKTIMVPPSDPNTILDQKIIKFIVLVDDKKLIEKANNLALDPPTPVDRYVIWYQSPDFAKLKNIYLTLPDDLSKVKAFSLSTINNVADIIKANEIIDYPRIEVSYTKAGLPEFN